MEALNNIPDWLGTAIIGAVIAVLGWVGASTYDWLEKHRAVRAAQLAQLQELFALLKASLSLFVAQNELRGRLENLLKANHPGNSSDILGYEYTFSHLFKQFTDKEKELHALIRSITVHSVHRVNQSMMEWLGKDQIFKSGYVRSRKRRELAENLQKLETHLNLWDARYEAWIPDHPEHALVYLADEQNLGVGFPSGIEDITAEVINELQTSRLI